MPTLAKLCDDPQVNADAEFMDNLQIFLEDQKPTSSFIRPYVNQIKLAKVKARRNINRRIEYIEINKQRQNKGEKQIEPETSQPVDSNAEGSLDDEEVEFETSQFDLDIEENTAIEPNIGEYWSIKNDPDLFVVIESKFPLTVQYYQLKKLGLQAKGKHHFLKEEVQGILAEDLDKKVPEPKIVAATKSRTFYLFE